MGLMATEMGPTSDASLLCLSAFVVVRFLIGKLYTNIQGFVDEEEFHIMP